MYRVLLQTENREIHTWDYGELWEAQRAYDGLSDYNRVMLMDASNTNVKLIREKSNDTVYNLKKRIAAEEQAFKEKRQRRTKNT